jgi:hypothetical protein
MVLLVFTLLPCCSAAETRSATVDLGWLRAEQNHNGWFVTRATYVSSTADKVNPGDAIIAVDGQRISDCNAITAAVFLRRIGSNAITAQIMRDGATRLLQLEPPTHEPLLKIAAEYVSDIEPPIYSEEALAPTLELIDETGKRHQIQYGPNWTLIHLWSTGCVLCWKDIAALNEVLEPAPANLEVVVVAINDAPETVIAFSRREPLRFKNFLGGDWIGGPAAKVLDPAELPTDVIVDPRGHVMFVGAGSDSLRSGLAFLKDVPVH